MGVARVSIDGWGVFPFFFPFGEVPMGGCNIFFGWKMVWGEMKWRGEESLFGIFLDAFPPFLGKETICPPPPSFFFPLLFLLSVLLLGRGVVLLAEPAVADATEQYIRESTGKGKLLGKDLKRNRRRDTIATYNPQIGQPSV